MAPFSVWAYDGQWNWMLATSSRLAADQVVRALAARGYRSQGRAVHVFGAVPWPRASYQVRGSGNPGQHYYWGAAPDATAAFIVGDALDRILVDWIYMYVVTPRGARVRTSQLLESVPYA